MLSPAFLQYAGHVGFALRFSAERWNHMFLLLGELLVG